MRKRRDLDKMGEQIGFDNILRVSDGLVCERCGNDVTINGFKYIGREVHNGVVITRFRCEKCECEYRQYNMGRVKNCCGEKNKSCE